MEEDKSQKQASFSTENYMVEEVQLDLTTEITNTLERINLETLEENNEVLDPEGVEALEATEELKHQEEAKTAQVVEPEQAKVTQVFEPQEAKFSEEATTAEEVRHLEEAALPEEVRHQEQEAEFAEEDRHQEKEAELTEEVKHQEEEEAELVEEVKHLKEPLVTDEADEPVEHEAEELKSEVYEITDETTQDHKSSVHEIHPAETAQSNVVSAEDEDSEIEDVRKSEREAEKTVEAVEESKKPVYRELLSIQKGYDSRYFAYLSEINQLNQKYESQFQQMFNDRKPSSSKIDNFWLTALKNNPLTASTIEEKDEQLLQHLKDISYSESLNGRELTLKFEFSENEFIEERVLTKTYVIDSDDNLKSTSSSKVTWKGDDFTTKKITEKKKNKRGKSVQTITKTVTAESFFNLFKEQDESSESDDSEDCNAGMMLGDDLEFAYEIRDEIVPYAFLWFLGIRKGYTEGDSGSESEKEPKEGLKVAKSSAVVEAGGSSPADCKQQ